MTNKLILIGLVLSMVFLVGCEEKIDCTAIPFDADEEWLNKCVSGCNNAQNMSIKPGITVKPGIDLINDSGYFKQGDLAIDWESIEDLKYKIEIDCRFIRDDEANYIVRFKVAELCREVYPELWGIE